MICPYCNKPVPYSYAEARKRARKKWRQSSKGKAWDKAYNQRPEVKAKRHERYIQNLIKECANER
tara:strand:+ start:526 stop:720 length:195 start_codon:yes stop_codon:yes gene_type:complete